VVHAAYYRRNRHLRVATFPDRLELTTLAGALLVLPYREMEAVELNAAGGIYHQPAWDKFTFQSYHYLKIRCHGQTHYLTSLLAKHPLEKAFPQLLQATAPRYTRRKRIIAYLD
jgi:hypothetical protein